MNRRSEALYSIKSSRPFLVAGDQIFNEVVPGTVWNKSRTCDLSRPYPPDSPQRALGCCASDRSGTSAAPVAAAFRKARRESNIIDKLFLLWNQCSLTG